MSKTETIRASEADTGAMGQKYLVAGSDVAMRLWQDQAPGESGTPHARDYETVGYVVSGRVELDIDGETVELAAGDSWHVPRGAKRSYRIIEALTAVEATHPAARDAGDERA